MDKINTNQGNTLESGENRKIPVAPLASQGILDSTVTHTIGVLVDPKGGNQANKNIVDYSFKFESAVSGLSVDDDTFIKKHLGEDAIKIRITCIRHGMSIEEEEHERMVKISGIKHLISQTRGTALCEGAKKQYREDIVGKLLALGMNNRNTYLFYCGETEDGPMVRVQESANILQEYLSIDNKHTIGNIVGLDSTDKEDDSEPRRASRTKLYNIDFAHQLINSTKDHSIRNINIVCVIHKSNVIGLGEGLLGYNVASHLSTINELKTGGMITIDIDSSGKPVNNHENYGTLKLDNTSYNKIIDILQYEEGLQDIFSLFNAGKIQIWEVQSYVNAYFVKNKTLFEKYLPHPVFRTFCLANLIKLKQYSIIESFYFSRKCTDISQVEKELLIGGIQNTNAEIQDDSLGRPTSIFRKLFIAREELWSDEDKILIEKYLGSDFYDELKRKRIEYCEVIEESNTNAQSILKNSIDKHIHVGNLIPRDLYFYRQKSEQELEKLLNEKKGASLSQDEKYNKVNTPLESLLKSSIPHILIGNVGDGKTTELVRMKYEIDTNPLYSDCITLFYSANTTSGGTNFLKVEKAITSLQDIFPDKKIVLFFDGIDELNGDIRDNLVTKLKGLHENSTYVIMGSRNLGFDIYEGTDLQTIHFKSIGKNQKKDFLLSRLRNLGLDKAHCPPKLQEIENFLSSSVLSEDIKETPLILLFLTLLCAQNRLKDIENRASLYEDITGLILIDHQKIKNIKNAEKWHIDDLFDALSYCAFQKHMNKKIQREDIIIYLGAKMQNKIGIGNRESILNSMVDQIFLLYRLEGGEYQFILKSFEEFFLARYIANQDSLSKNELYPHATEGESIIFNMVDAVKFTDYRDDFYPVVLFYTEILINNKHFDRLEVFFSDNGLLKYDDATGEKFFVGLEIVYNLAERAKNHGKIGPLLYAYMDEMNYWNLNDLRTPNIEIDNASKIILYKASTIINRIASIIDDTGVSILEGELSGIISPKIIGAYRHHILEFFQEKEFGSIQRVCIILATSGHTEGLKESINWAKILMGNDRSHEAAIIYKALVRSSLLTGQQEPVRGTETLMSIWEPYLAGGTCKSLPNFGNGEWLKSAIGRVRIFMKYEMFLEAIGIYKALVKSGNKRGRKEALKGLKLYIQNERFDEARIIHEELYPYTPFRIPNS